MNIYGGINGYFYCKRLCRNKIYKRHGNILENTRISITQFIIFCHYFYNRTIITKNNLSDTKLSRGRIMKHKYNIENKIQLYNQNNEIMMVGIGSIVEVEESLMSSAKYRKGRYSEQTWVFGIVERDKGKCHIEVVPDRKKKTLENIIKGIVRESTIICTDQAKMYTSLDGIGYIHFDDCHKKKFVDPETGCHAKTI
ncbi:hypothetical protein DMUE_4187 [Dictyocoela muelleri]|nr:hypothetical protein DMUE_4187 [Dictyocoela muelleri]